MKMVMKTIEIILGALICWRAPCLLLHKQGIPFLYLIYPNANLNIEEWKHN
ncbi:hypothetical protein BKK39_15625 [Bacillus cereus]|nr:hypothetical protein CK938_10345 [Bacillus cereus]EEK43993.1 hypothetical protein bcere0001_31300 [Bacillus cereus m1293]OJE28117.1 hypothetical protein BAQ46_06930 [Bacillus paranthracis]KXY12359.1 hypothetical protein AT271_23670 [Bacillus cereus]ONG70263.1 hypothetical protein BKK44_13940 [Bacillus cereus]